MTGPVFVLYLPAFHAGYEAAFRQSSAKTLLILGEEVLSDFKLKEIRQADPKTMVKAVGALGFFDEVREAGIEDLKALDGTEVILADDAISDALHARYFPKATVTKVSVFLRWDENAVKGAYGEAEYDSSVSREDFDRDVMKRAGLEAEKSSDWFRRIGGALVVDGAIRLVGHNQRMPSEGEVWAVGDPRMYVEYGSDPHLRTTMHAEEGLIVEAAKEGLATKGAWIYTTVFPCAGCAGMIALSGITRVYFKEGYAALHGYDILKAYGVELIRVEEPRT